MLEKVKNQNRIKPASLSQACWRAKKGNKSKMIDLLVYEYIRNLRFCNKNTYKEIKEIILEKFKIKRSIEQIRRYCMNNETPYNFTERKKYKKINWEKILENSIIGYDEFLNITINGQNIKEFCKSNNITNTTAYNNIKKYKKEEIEKIKNEIKNKKGNRISLKDFRKKYKI